MGWQVFTLRTWNCLTCSSSSLTLLLSSSSSSVGSTLSWGKKKYYSHSDAHLHVCFCALPEIYSSFVVWTLNAPPPPETDKNTSWCVCAIYQGTSGKVRQAVTPLFTHPPCKHCVDIMTVTMRFHQESTASSSYQLIQRIRTSRNISIIHQEQ